MKIMPIDGVVYVRCGGVRGHLDALGELDADRSALLARGLLDGWRPGERESDRSLRLLGELSALGRGYLQLFKTSEQTFPTDNFLTIAVAL